MDSELCASKALLWLRGVAERLSNPSLTRAGHKPWNGVYEIQRNKFLCYARCILTMNPPQISATNSTRVLLTRIQRECYVPGEFK